MQKQGSLTYPFLYSLKGFQYCDLLLGQGQVQEVKERAAETLELAMQHRRLALIASGQPLTGPRMCCSKRNRQARAIPRRQQSFCNALWTGCDEQGQCITYRADCWRARSCIGSMVITGGPSAIWPKCLRIATRGPMGLYIADYHLESARLHLARGKQNKAREHYSTAKEMIERMGYHRRDNEVKEIAQQLGLVITTDDHS